MHEASRALSGVLEVAPMLRRTEMQESVDGGRGAGVLAAVDDHLGCAKTRGTFANADYASHLMIARDWRCNKVFELNQT